MSLATEQRKIEVSKFLKNVRSLAGPVEVSRSNIEKIKDSLVTMASKKELWCEDEFPAPIGDSVQTRYLISQDDDDSYVASLFRSGINKIAQKVGEEAVETIIEAKDSDDELFLSESADLLFHYLILLEAKGFSLKDIEQRLASRSK